MPPGNQLSRHTTIGSSNPTSLMLAAKHRRAGQNVLRKWVKEFAADPQMRFPARGR